jgi:hypothetical protein
LFIKGQLTRSHRPGSFGLSKVKSPKVTRVRHPVNNSPGSSKVNSSGHRFINNQPTLSGTTRWTRGVPLSLKTATSLDPKVGLCLGPCGGPRGVLFRISEVPLHGPFIKSQFTWTQLTCRPYAVNIWSRDPQESGGEKYLLSTKWRTHFMVMRLS